MSEPVGFDDQQITGQVFKRALRGCADKQAFPAVARHGAHDDDVGFEFFSDQWQFFMGQAGDQVRIVIGEFVELS